MHIPSAGNVSATDETVYAAIASYAPEEPVCWPAQTRIAKDAGVSVRTVVSSVKALRKARWLTVTKQWTWRDEHGRHVLDPEDTTGLARSKWQHNVYELLAPFQASEEAFRKRVRAAHRRADLRALHTNPVGEEKRPPGGWCRCPSCRPVRTSTRCRAPVHPWTVKAKAILAAFREDEEVYGELTLDEKRLKARLVHLRFAMRDAELDREFPPPPDRPARPRR
ncbi:MAG: helix-turn-helix domain-containing protein [Solirubrobacteraceae bacterium]